MSDVADRPKDELLEEARRKEIPGRSSMTKEELQEALGNVPSRDRSKPLREPNGRWFHDHLLSLTVRAVLAVVAGSALLPVSTGSARGAPTW